LRGMHNIVVAITSLSDWCDVACRDVDWQRRYVRQCRRGMLTGGVAPVLARRSGDVREDGRVPPVEPTHK
jgi:hypothetical protein